MAADHRRSMSVEKIESLSGVSMTNPTRFSCLTHLLIEHLNGLFSPQLPDWAVASLYRIAQLWEEINTEAGELAVVRNSQVSHSRFSLIWRAEDGGMLMLMDVFDLCNYDLEHWEQTNTVQLRPHSTEKKEITITFKDSESLRQFRANIFQDVMRMKSKSVSSTDKKLKRSKTMTVHGDTFNEPRPTPAESMRGVLVKDVHVRHNDLSSPATLTTDQTDAGQRSRWCSDEDNTCLHGPLESDEDQSSSGSDDSDESNAPEWALSEEEFALINTSRRRSNRAVVEETSLGIQHMRLEDDAGESSV